MGHRTNLFCMVVGCTLLSAPAFARNYEKLWKEVADYQQKDLPQSALKSARSIFQKAMNDDNKGEMIRAYLYMLQMKSSISADSLQPDMKRLENMTATSKDSVEKAVLHSLLGTLYISNQYRGQYDTKEVPAIPDDMSEWSEKVYQLKARQHFSASLSNIPLLSHTSMSAWLPVIQRGNTDKYLGNNMLDILGTTAVTALSSPADTTFVNAYYERLINYYAGEGNKNGVLLATLRQLNEAYNQRRINSPAYEKKIKQLIADNASSECCAEAYIALAEKDELWVRRHSEQLAFVQKGIADYPKYMRINALKAIETNLKAPSLVLSSSDTPLPGKAFNIRFSWANIEKATLTFYRIKEGFSIPLKKDYDKLTTEDEKFEKQKENFLKTYTDNKAFLTRTFELKGKALEMNDSTFQSPELPAGLYFVTLTAPGAAMKQGNYVLMPVSSLRSINQNILVDNKPAKEIRIVDVFSGKPVPEASVIQYDNYDRALAPIHADNQGIVRTSKAMNYRLVSPKDNYSTIRYMGIPVQRRDETTDHITRLYTDRSIYRPGQTVKVAGIAYSQLKDSARVSPDKTWTLTLRDANNKTIGEKKITTNDYGSFSAEFTLPTSTLPGIFRLNTTFGETDFRVEEYKRPTFDVTFEKLHEGYKAGDSLSIVGTAKTFAGFPLQNVKVSYTIHVNRLLWRMGNDNLPEDISGTSTTDSEGHFIVPLHLMNIPAQSRLNYRYEYRVKAQVVSQAGETQEGTLTLPLSNHSLYISINGLGNGDRICKETTHPITINVKNLQGIPVDCPGNYTITPVETSGEKRHFSKKIRGFTANKTSISEELSLLPSGKYRLTTAIKDKTSSQEITDTLDFILYSKADTRPPVRTEFWHEVISNELSKGYSPAPQFALFEEGKKTTGGWIRKDIEIKKEAEIQVGTSLKDVLLYYRLYSGNTCLEDRQILLNDSVITFRYTYQPAYKNGLYAKFAFVKDGRLYQSTDQIYTTQPDKKLTMEWLTFRDKLVPGQKESWTMWLARDDREKFDGAEVLASMYDASLDKFASPDNWTFGKRQWLAYSYPGQYNLTYDTGNVLPYMTVYFPRKFNFTSIPLTFSQLTIYPYPLTTNRYFGQMTRSFFAGGLQNKGVFQNSMVGMGNLALPESAVVMQKYTQSAKSDGSKVFDSVAQPGVITPETDNLFAHAVPRSDFNETAFFYPHLRTDDTGKFSISFTLPDALTQWRFRILAHTKDMLTFTGDTTITASKDFMVQPNLPRYTRGGDVVSFPASLTNLTNKALKGIARMELLNPNNQQIIYTESQHFTLTGGKTYGLNFNWKADDKYPAVICRIQAVSGNTSDGEQSWVPVLSNREPVTESIVLSINGRGEKQYSLKNLFQKNDKEATNRRLTVEFTSNPVWYAIQVLPTIVEEKETDALSLSSALYAEALAQYIVSQYPRLRTIFDRWKQENVTSQSLWSNLQKNQELKTVLLNETPWVTKAESEAERKQRLSTLFDVNSLTYKLGNTLRKLGERQQEDGGWSWYSDMKTNGYITLSIAEQLARLQKLTHNKTLVHDLLAKAMTYLDKQVKETYEQLKKNKVAYSNNNFVLRTYYIQALLGNLKNDMTTNYFLDGWEKYPSDLSIEDKARCAIIMKAVGRNTAAEDNIKSLLEHTVKTDELGRYFDQTSNRRRYFWEDNQIPTQTLVIEALKESGTHTQEVAEMSQWLLKQKQAQAWANTVQSVNSIYALLIGNASMTLDNQAPATLTLNGSPVKTDKDIAETGYVHYSYTSGNNVSQPTTLTIKKTTSGIGWGGVYAQYTLPLAKIVSSTTANDSVKASLSVRREFYIERAEGNKTVRHPLSQITAKTGDKLISRLIVKTDRDMEFVQIKDGRASCAEPANTISGYQYKGGIGYYEVPKDASTEYFCDRLDKGTHIFENTSYIDRAGSYMSGTASVQCAYAPEFITRAEPVRIEVK